MKLQDYTDNEQFQAGEKRKKEKEDTLFSFLIFRIITLFQFTEAIFEVSHETRQKVICFDFYIRKIYKIPLFESQQKRQAKENATLSISRFKRKLDFVHLKQRGGGEINREFHPSDC